MMINGGFMMVNAGLMMVNDDKWLVGGLVAMNVEFSQ